MTSRDTALNAGWKTQHDHSRCWWNWEVGRWVCPTDAAQAAASDQLSSEPDPQEQR